MCMNSKPRDTGGEFSGSDPTSYSDGRQGARNGHNSKATGLRHP